MENEYEKKTADDASPTDSSQPAGDPTGSAQTEAEESLSDELFRELTVLGSRLVEVAQTAWNSEERKQIQGDLKEGLSSVAESLEEGFQKVVDNEQAKDVIDKADGVADSVGSKLRSSQAVNDIGESLVQGLSILAGKLETWTEEMAADKRSPGSETPDSETAGEDPSTDSQAQDIPIDRE